MYIYIYVYTYVMYSSAEECRPRRGHQGGPPGLNTVPL